MLITPIAREKNILKGASGYKRWTFLSAEEVSEVIYMTLWIEQKLFWFTDQTNFPWKMLRKVRKRHEDSAKNSFEPLKPEA